MGEGNSIGRKKMFAMFAVVGLIFVASVVPTVQAHHWGHQGDYILGLSLGPLHQSSELICKDISSDRGPLQRGGGEVCQRTPELGVNPNLPLPIVCQNALTGQKGINGVCLDTPPSRVYGGSVGVYFQGLFTHPDQRDYFQVWVMCADVDGYEIGDIKWLDGPKYGGTSTHVFFDPDDLMSGGADCPHLKIGLSPYQKTGFFGLHMDPTTADGPITGTISTKACQVISAICRVQ